MDNETESKILALYDFTKVCIALELLDKNNGELIFPFTPLGSQKSTVVLFSLEHLLVIRTLDAQVSFVNHRVTI